MSSFKTQAPKRKPRTRTFSIHFQASLSFPSAVELAVEELQH